MRRHEIRFPAKDAALREDAHILGALVGEVIREQAGDALFDKVETARRAAIRRREGEPAAEAELCAVVDGLNPADASALVHGFGTYFQVVNLAETVHRIRRRRAYLRAQAGPQRASLADAVQRLARAGFGLDDVRGLLDRLAVEPVFTAHPTEATRRTILEKHQAIARALVDRLDPSRTPDEERAALGRIRAEVTTAWQTEPLPPERPTVLDELEHVLFFVTNVLYRIIPRFYEALEDALGQTFGVEARGMEIPTVVRFGSWVGGDMDGNPNVTAETISAALARHRELVLGLYRAELDQLQQRLSQSRSRTAVRPEVEQLITGYATRLPGPMAGVPRRHRDMPYRVLCRLIAARLDRTAHDEDHGYPSAAAFLADLRSIARSLEENRGRHAGLFAVRRLIRRVETFGFHLVTLDVRQDARVHRAVAGRLLSEAAWEARGTHERVERLVQALGAGEPPVALDAGAEQTFAVFRAIAAGRRRYGDRAVGPFVVSMARGPDDVLTVLLLARWAGLTSGGMVPLDLVPLFETMADLEAAPAVMRDLVALDAYRAHLSGRGDHQMVMIGYSDSNKDGGLAASRWALQEAQAALVRALEPRGVSLTVFHGRGGTVGRGGGKTHRAVLAAPAGSVRGRLRVTEQGEMISAKYGLRGIALRTLEQMVGAVALATARPPQPSAGEPARREIMDLIAARSRAAHRALVHGDDRFPDYFRCATPIDVIERMPIGSRPARRGGGGIESLRAIPWVFAWTQSRHLLPGWYGLGAGLTAAVERFGEETVAVLAVEWPFFRTLLDDAEMVLAKADMPIAARYATLAGDAGVTLFGLIRGEFDRTVAALLRLKGTTALLDHDPALQRSIRLRNPYVDPMSLLQIDLLRRWRAADRRDDALLGALLATVNGIAQGLRNTG